MFLGKARYPGGKYALQSSKEVLSEHPGRSVDPGVSDFQYVDGILLETILRPCGFPRERTRALRTSRFDID